MKSSQLFSAMLGVGLLVVSVMTFMGLSNVSHETTSSAQFVTNTKSKPISSIYYTYNKGMFAHCAVGTQYDIYGYVVYKGAGLSIPTPPGYNAYAPIVVSYQKGLQFSNTSSSNYLIVWASPSSQLAQPSAVFTPVIYSVQCALGSGSDKTLIALQ